MRKPILIVAFVLFAASLCGVYFLHQYVIDLGYEPCALSIESAFGMVLGRPDTDLSRRIPVTNEWRYLEEDEERMLFDAFAGRSFDCKQYPEFANGEALRGDKGRMKVRNDGTLVGVWIEAKDSRSRYWMLDGD